MLTENHYQYLFKKSVLLAIALLLCLAIPLTPSANAADKPDHAAIAAAVGKLNSLILKQEAEIAKMTKDVENEKKKHGKLAKDQKLANDEAEKIRNSVKARYYSSMKDAIGKLNALRPRQ